MAQHEEDHALCATFLAAMDVLAKPWNGMLMAVLDEGPLRFSELSARVPAIGDRMLAVRLKELEARALVVRRVEPGPPVRVSYELTDVGRGYREVTAAVTRWGQMIVKAQREREERPTPSRAREEPPARSRRRAGARR